MLLNIWMSTNENNCVKNLNIFEENPAKQAWSECWTSSVLLFGDLFSTGLLLVVLGSSCKNSYDSFELKLEDRATISEER